MRRAFWFVLFTLIAAPLQAQVVVQQTSSIAVPASPDHNVTVGTINLVTSYTLIVRPQGSSTVVFTRALGKPTPDGAGVFSVPFGWTPAEFTNLASGFYVFTTVTNGPGGASAEAPLSDPFAKVSSPRPAGKGTVVP